MAHGGDEQHIPLDSRKLAEGGFDYIALGHRHQHQNLFKDWCLYPGALEPVDRNDQGEHGYIEGTYDRGYRQNTFCTICFSFLSEPLSDGQRGVSHSILWKKCCVMRS